MTATPRRTAPSALAATAAATTGSILLAAAVAAFAVPAAAEPARTSAATSVEIEDFVGTLIVERGPATAYEIVDGSRKMSDRVTFEERGGVLTVTGDFRSSPNAPWWRFWDSWSFEYPEDLKKYPTLTIAVPGGAAVTVEDAVGRAEIGDVMGDLVFEGGPVEADIGRMRSARIEVRGSGDIGIDDVSERLVVAVAGSGDVRAAGAGSATVSIAGSGSARLASVSGDFGINIAGSGDVFAETVDGAVIVSIAGSGDIRIDGGRADPFKVRINGSGDLDFGGTAVDPDVKVNGSGEVRIGAYEGTLDQSGNGEIRIGG